MYEAYRNLQSLDVICGALYPGELYKTASPLLIDPTGNNQTLDVPNIHEIVKDFYDRYYDKSKVVMVTSGHLPEEVRQAVDMKLKQFDEKSEMKSNQGSTTGNMSWVMPNFTQDYFIFKNSTEAPLFHYFFNIEYGQNHSAEINLLGKILNDSLYQSLVIDTGFAEEVEVELDIFKGATTVVLQLTLSNSGTNRFPQITKIVFSAIVNLMSQLNHDTFKTWQRASKAAVFLDNIEDKEIDLIAQLATNYAEHGFKEVFTAGKIPKNLNLKTIIDITEHILKSPLLVVYNGPLPEGAFDSTQSLGRVFMGLDRVNFRDIPEYIQTKLDVMLKGKGTHYKFEFSSFSLDRQYLLKLLLFAAVENFPIRPVDPAIGLPSVEYLLQLTQYEPTGLFFRQQNENSSVVVFINEKHQDKLTSIFINLSPDEFPSKETYIWMKYYTEILNRRAKRITRNYAKYNTRCFFTLDAYGINMRIELNTNNPEQLVNGLVDELFFGEQISIEEHQSALGKLTEILDDDKDLYWLNRVALNKTLLPYIAGQKDLELFKQNMEDGSITRPLELSKLYWSLVFVQQTSKGIDLDKLADALRRLEHRENQFMQQSPIELEPLKVLLVREDLTMGEYSDTKAYVSCHRLGPSNERNFVIVTLMDQVLYNVAFSFLREQNGIGYIAGTRMLETRNTTFWCVYSQSDKQLSVIEELMEEFLFKSEQFLSSMSEESFATTKKIVRQMLENYFTSPAEEAMFWYYATLRGYDENFLKNAIGILDGFTIEEFLREYLQSHKTDPRRVILESMHRSLLNYDLPLIKQIYQPQATTVVRVIQSEA